MPETIREHIEKDLARRCRNEKLTASNLTLQSLANHYGVSITPIRQALQTLIQSGLIAKGKNGRLDLGSSRSRTSSQKLKTEIAPTALPSRSAEIEAALIGDVIRAGLRGDTDYLREEATAKKLNVGRTAIRQVFSRLHGKGLLIHVPRCGWKVRPFDSVDLAAYLVLREALELKALELARPHLLKDDLKRMLAGNSADVGREGTGSGIKIDNEIHKYLIAKSANSYLQDFFERNGAYYTTLFDFATPETKLVRQMAAQHRAILKALIAEDWNGAKTALVDHIRAQRPVVEALMKRLAENSANGTENRLVSA